eukprot:maker-scaffold_6-augustus-gene-15.24-mRNA-1 protein AED:0.07 eAED:0.07 QI:0/0/0/1/1/1/2/0/1006
MPTPNVQEISTQMKKVLSITSPVEDSNEYTFTSKFTRNRIRIKELLKSPKEGEEYINQSISVSGWTRTIRWQDKKQLAFISLNDGSCFESLQIVANSETTENFSEIQPSGGIGSSFQIEGLIIASPSSAQKIELQAKKVTLLGKSDANKYPLKKTKHAHSMEFLRDNAHLRPRTNLIGAVTRVRNCLAFAAHNFFQERGFLYINTPIITGADGEGAGEMFAVSTLLDSVEQPGKKKKKPLAQVKEHARILTKEGHNTGKIDMSKDFFSKEAFLTVTGQLNVEAFAVSMSDCYTFGPTFRAENSHTSRHLAEFWMIEPEMCFCTLPDLINLAEDFLKYCLVYAINHCKSDLEFFEQRIEPGLMERLKNVLDNDFQRMTYTEAIDELMKSEAAGTVKFNEKVEWGIDLGSEHERYLTEKIYKKPVVLVDYPASFKAFYMKRNELGDQHESRQTVQGMDILVPRIGEIVGGSVREERLSILEEVVKAQELPKENYEWYLDLRRFGTVPHAGFGVGFERLVMFATGVENIRDVIPFPRTPGHSFGFATCEDNKDSPRVDERVLQENVRFILKEKLDLARKEVNNSLLIGTKAHQPVKIVKQEGKGTVLRFSIPLCVDSILEISKKMETYLGTGKQLNLKEIIFQKDGDLFRLRTPQIFGASFLSGLGFAEISLETEDAFSSQDVDIFVDLYKYTIGIDHFLGVNKKEALINEFPWSDGFQRNTATESHTREEAIAELKKLGAVVYDLPSGVKANIWDALAGYENAKKQIEDTLLLSIKNPEVYKQISEQTHDPVLGPTSTVARSVLFEGPAGCGKTSSARIIGAIADTPLIYIPIEVIMSKFYGESENNLASIFKLAGGLGEVIFFFDEIDSLATSRSDKVHEATRRVLSVLLREMDGFIEGKEKTMVIAATNRKEDLDPALLSRFSLSIKFDLPDPVTREKIFQLYANHLSTADLEKLANATDGYSGRDIKMLCQLADREKAGEVIRNNDKISPPSVETYLKLIQAGFR